VVQGLRRRMPPASMEGIDNAARLRTVDTVLYLPGEPIPGSPLVDLLCFTVDQQRYRGIVVPAFTTEHALAEAVAQNQDWEGRPVVRLSLEDLRKDLTGCETVVIDPWTPREHHVAQPVHQAVATDGTPGLEAAPASSH
jgi:hypothetical protein